MLYGEVVPPVGGDTCFTSLERLCQALSPRMIEFLSGLTAVHSGRGVFAINAAQKRLGVTGDVEAIEKAAVEHPVICKHPATGRPYVFVSSVMTNFVGMTEDESRPIIDFLVATAIRPENNCRLRWAEGTLGIWNNPFILHTAIGDYPGYRRVMYRTTIEGDRPVATSGAAAPVSAVA